MSVERIDILGCFIDTRDFNSEPDWDAGLFFVLLLWLSWFYPSHLFWLFRLTSKVGGTNDVLLSLALLEFPLTIDSLAEFMDYFGDFLQFVKAANGKNSFFMVS